MEENSISAMYEKYQDITIEKVDRLLTLTLNRPEKLNATDARLHRELSQIFTDAGSDSTIDVIVLTGAGRAFCAGGDIQWMEDLIAHPEQWYRTVTEAKRIVFSLLDCEKPVIAKLNGSAVGLGATIALFCDVVFASEKAKIGDPHVSVGFVAGDGGSAIWPQLVGYTRAKEFLMTGNLLSAERAERIGLINYCVPHEELDDRVDAFTQQLLRGATKAIQSTKMAVNATLRQIVSANIEASLALEGLSNFSAEHREGTRAFIEKRLPVYR